MPSTSSKQPTGDDRPAVERAATPSPARAQGGPVASEHPARPEWIPEGTRAELEANGEAVDPRNGRLLVGTGADDARYAEPGRRRGVQASDVAGSVGATAATNGE